VSSALASLLVIGLLSTAAVSAGLGRRNPRLAVDLVRVALALALAGAIALAVAARSTDHPADGLVALDGLGTLLSIFVLATAVVVTSFASRALAAHRHAERFFAASAALVGSTLALALANRPLWMAAGWVAVSASTVWVIGSDGRRSSRRAARRAARAFAIGDAALVAAVALAITSTHGVTSTADVAAAVGRQGGSSGCWSPSGSWRVPWPARRRSRSSPGSRHRSTRRRPCRPCCTPES